MYQVNEIEALRAHHDAAVALIAPGSETRAFAVRTASGMTRSLLVAMKNEVRSTGRTIVTLIYDATLPAFSLRDVWLMRPTEDPKAIGRGDDLDLFIQCKLWAPANSNRIVVVGPDQFDGHFTVSTDGTRFEAKPGKPAKDLSRGAARASMRIARLAASRDFVPKRAATMMIAA